jgi:hypothetical protein
MSSGPFHSFASVFTACIHRLGLFSPRLVKAPNPSFCPIVGRVVVEIGGTAPFATGILAAGICEYLARCSRSSVDSRSG